MLRLKHFKNIRNEIARNFNKLLHKPMLNYLTPSRYQPIKIIY